MAPPASPSAASCFQRWEWSPWSCATGSPSAVRQSNDYTCFLNHAADLLPQSFTDDLWQCIFLPTGLQISFCNCAYPLPPCRGGLLKNATDSHMNKSSLKP